MNNDSKIEEKSDEAVDIKNLYNNLVHYEIELFKNRWAVFTTLMSIHFVVIGLGLKEFLNEANYIILIITSALALFIYLIAFFHYFYFHGLAHAIREGGEKLEKNSCGIFTIRRKYRESKTIRFHSIIIFFTLFYIPALLFIIIYLFVKD